MLLGIIAAGNAIGMGDYPMAGIWAGGDCAAGGDDLTVTAVAEGRDAALDIHQALDAKFQRHLPNLFTHGVLYRGVKTVRR